MKRRFSSLMAMLLLVGTLFGLSAQNNDAFLANYLIDFNGASSKLTQLVDATPENMFSWRPAVGIRSVGESYMHIAAANFGLSAAMGVAYPEGLPQNLEAEVTAKADIDRVLKHSQEQVRKAVEMQKSADLSETITAFGQSMPRYQVLMILAGHSHEHLGQSIAYVRSIGIVPPWSQ